MHRFPSPPRGSSGSRGSRNGGGLRRTCRSSRPDSWPGGRTPRTGSPSKRARLRAPERRLRLLSRRSRGTRRLYGRRSQGGAQSRPIEAGFVASTLGAAADGETRTIPSPPPLRRADRFAGPLVDAPYFGRYERMTIPWRMAVGEVDGQPAVIVLREDNGAW